ncbi:uncharacterized protein LOC143188354 [Calliopsis andreniformis]|uniref:uncharacterized protein LOC143188354 n=1 Tax=Calliopsis andreniformis TaxID=337506 RepID=UPI003FCD52E0
MLLSILLLPLVAAAPQQSTLENYIVDLQNGTLKNVQFRGDPVSELDLSNMEIRYINENALCYLSNLRSLNLANNSLKTLPASIFSNLSHLNELNLSYNRLGSLTNEPFYALKELRVLDISYNPMKYLYSGKLCGLTKSTTILTKGNMFDGISTQAFKNTTKELIDSLSSRPQKESTTGIEQKYRKKGKAVDKIKADFEAALKIQRSPTIELFLAARKLKLCISNGIVLSIEPLEEDTEIAEGSSCMELSMVNIGPILDLRNLGIKGFQKGWYQLQVLPIFALNLANNDITEITKEMLNDLPADLFAVNLERNKIRSVKSQVIENSYIKWLELNSNFISEIETGALQKTQLTFLFLYDNQLRDLSFVSSLPSSLTIFLLNNNLITSIPNEAFSHLNTLRLLKLDNNNIETLQSNVFKGLTSLSILSIANNNLTKIEQPVLSDLENLKSLNLDGNKLRKISNKTFAYLPQTLKDLSLEFNEIDSLEAGSFVKVPKNTLSLSRNKISSVPRGTFDLPTLKELYLDQNNLTTIDGDSYEGLPQLFSLWLSNNQIKEIPKGSCRNLKSLVFLDISNNPFVRLENGALYGLNIEKDNFVCISNNCLEEIQAGVFDNI